MTLAALAVDIVFVCCVAAYLLHRYGDWRKQRWVVTLACFISWYFPFMIIFVLPIDVSNTFYRQCLQNLPVPTPTSLVPFNVTSRTINESASDGIVRRSADDQVLGAENSTPSTSTPPHTTPSTPKHCIRPWSYVPEDTLPTFWHVIYWTSQALTWVILPMMQSYANAGNFTVMGKIKAALIANAIYYGTYLLIFGVCLIYVAVKPNLHLDGPQIKVLAITASNTWGLFLLVLLMGYGLVEVPRTIWNSSKKGYMLQHTYFKIAKLSIDKTEAEENLEDVMDDVKKASDTIRYNHALRKHVDTILSKCPESVQQAVPKNMDDFEDFNNPTETPTVSSLVRLHKKVIQATQAYCRTQCQWAVAMEKAFDLEDIAENESSPRRVFVRAHGTYNGPFKKCYNPKIEWYWKCILRPWGLRALTVLTCVVVIIIVWSECLFFVKKPVLSIFALFIQLAARNYDYLMIEFVSFCTIAFLSCCAYFTMFRIRVFNWYYLAAHHQTPANSLIYFGMLLCRLTPPLCLNFLGLIHLDSHITTDKNMVETAYTQIMGHMDVISFIANGFNIYFPILIVLLCIATYFRLGTRLLHCIGFQQFIGDDEMTQELIDEGRGLVRREKRRRMRQEEGEARRRDWNERLQGKTMGQDSESDSGGRRRAGSKGKTAKSPTENDRTELLKEVEPLDYTGGIATESYSDFGPQSSNINTAPDESIGRYQTQSSRGPAAGASRFGSSLARSAVGPPRDIFDDV